MAILVKTRTSGGLEMNFRKGLFGLLCLFTLNTAAAQDTGNIVVTGAWVRATVAAGAPEVTPEPGGVTGAYMTIANETEGAVALTAVSTSAAAFAEIHESQMDDGIMRMNMLERLEIQPGERVVLEPGSFHIMLMDLARGLAPGDAISLTLTFEPLATSAALSIVPIELVLGVPVLDAPPPTSEFIVTEAWARPTVNDIAGMDMAPRPTAEGGMVSPEGQAEATEMPGMATGNMHEASSTDQGVSAAYFHLTNLGEPDRLIAVSTDAAGLVEIHEMQMADGVMRMNPIDGIDLPTGETAVLEPGGFHLMLMAVTRPLVSGEALTLTLTFESGKTLTVAVPIYDLLMMIP
jgi:periplasmic copper chaperone A